MLEQPNNVPTGTQTIDQEGRLQRLARLAVESAPILRHAGRYSGYEFHLA